MNAYGAEQTHNVILLEHGGTGKTTVTEALALPTGAAKHMGEVPDGSTISDYDKEETKRQFSISTTLTPLGYEGENGPIKINLLDTPGFFNFVGEAEETISVADAAIIAVNRKTGIEPGTERVWEIYEKYSLSRLILVTNMDDDHTGYREPVVKLGTKFGRKIASFQLPIREDEEFVGLVSAVRVDGRHFTHLSDYEECEIPDYAQKNLIIVGDALVEAVIETSEEYMERYFLGEEFTQEEAPIALRTYVIKGDIVPVMMRSGIDCQDFKVLLQAIDKRFPSPDHLECINVDISTDERFIAKYNGDISLSARVFKAVMDSFIGKYSLMKVCTDTLKGDTVTYSVNKDTGEKIGKLYILRGKDQIEVQELKAGDVGIVAKLTVTQTGDTMVMRTALIVHHKPQASIPYTYMAYKAVNKGEDDKVSTALAKMMEEDLAFEMANGVENHQALLYGIRDQRLDVVVGKLQSHYKVDVTLNQPKFTFRETLCKKIKVQGKHKKQSGGYGQYSDVIMESEPSNDLETPYVFEEKVLGGSVPRNYFPAIREGLQGCVLKGSVTGYPVMDLKAASPGGLYHLVDSLETASRMATTFTFEQGFMKANPVLLEPIASLKVTVSDKFTGDIIDDLSRRRRRVLSMNSNYNGKQVIEANAPMSKLFGHNTDLHSVTGGPGGYSYEFSRYEQAPGDVQKREIETKAAARDGE